MTAENTFTLAQLRGAVLLWEMDVRKNRDQFIDDGEAREIPILELADRYMETIGGYLDKVERGDGGAGEPIPLLVAGEAFDFEGRLRDEFAMHVIQGIVAQEGAAKPEFSTVIAADCEKAYAYAGGMMRARGAV